MSDLFDDPFFDDDHLFDDPFFDDPFDQESGNKITRLPGSLYRFPWPKASWLLRLWFEYVRPSKLTIRYLDFEDDLCEVITGSILGRTYWISAEIIATEAFFILEDPTADRPENESIEPGSTEDTK